MKKGVRQLTIAELKAAIDDSIRIINGKDVEIADLREMNIQLRAKITSLKEQLRPAPPPPREVGKNSISMGFM